MKYVPMWLKTNLDVLVNINKSSLDLIDWKRLVSQHVGVIPIKIEQRLEICFPLDRPYRHLAFCAL